MSELDMRVATFHGNWSDKEKETLCQLICDREDQYLHPMQGYNGFNFSRYADDPFIRAWRDTWTHGIIGEDNFTDLCLRLVMMWERKIGTAWNKPVPLDKTLLEKLQLYLETA